MKVIYGIGRIKKRFRAAVVTIGIFDGVHRGHKYIIKETIKRARQLKGTSMVLTFDPHPVNVLRPRNYLPLLISLEHRIRLFKALKVDVVIVERFSKRFSRLTPGEFIKNLFLKKIDPKEILVGSGFTFGRDACGDTDSLRKMGDLCNFRIREISPLKIGRRVISSTLIRRLIQEGKLKDASRCLGREVSLLGKVMGGKRKARVLGFPTANIYPCGEVTPPAGVYATRVIFNNKKFDSMTFVGRSPTFETKIDTMCADIEVHIFDFNKKIYNRYIEIEFLKKIRKPRKFNSQDSLREQIKKDELAVRHFFGSWRKK
jgi:riboflavin kinase/FMN adenylyltransferase